MLVPITTILRKRNTPPVIAPDDYYSYMVFTDGLTVTPNATNNTSIITSNRPVFRLDIMDQEVLFSSHRIHKNPLVYPTDLTENFIPGFISCRYSKVIEYIDEYNVKVDFCYNGGVIEAPVVTENTGGYFFIDRAAHFHNELKNNHVLELSVRKTYVVKGGWNVLVNNNKTIICNNIRRANIKLSFEDVFFSNANLAYNTTSNNGYLNTYFCDKFFIDIKNTDFDVLIENVNILPPTFNISSSNILNHYASYLFFGTTALASGEYLTGKRTIRNCSTMVESGLYIEADEVWNIAYYPSNYIAPVYPQNKVEGGTYFAPQISQTYDGGAVTGNEISKHYEVILENVQWQGGNMFSNRDSTRSGFLLKSVGVSPLERNLLASSKYVSNGAFNNVRVNISKLQDNTMILTTKTPDWNPLFIYNQYWVTGSSANNNIQNNRNNVHIKVYINGEEFKLFVQNKGAFVKLYKDPSYTFPPGNINASQDYNKFKLNFIDYFYIKQLIPIVGEIIPIDGKYTKRIDCRTYTIENYALQSFTTRPFEETTNIVFNNTISDKLEYFDTTSNSWVELQVLSRVQTVETIQGIPPADDTKYQSLVFAHTFDKDVPETVTQFRVKSSILSQVLGQDIDVDVFSASLEPSYLNYSTNTNNLYFKNTITVGFNRAATNDNIVPDGWIKDDPTTITDINQLYKLPST